MTVRPELRPVPRPLKASRKIASAAPSANSRCATEARRIWSRVQKLSSRAVCPQVGQVRTPEARAVAYSVASSLKNARHEVSGHSRPKKPSSSTGRDTLLVMRSPLRRGGVMPCGTRILSDIGLPSGAWRAPGRWRRPPRSTPSGSGHEPVSCGGGQAESITRLRGPLSSKAALCCQSLASSDARITRWPFPIRASLSVTPRQGSRPLLGHNI